MRNYIERLQLKLARYRRVRLSRRIRAVKRRSRHPYAVPVFTFTILIFITGVGLLLLHHHDSQLPPTPTTKIVIISHDGVQQTVPSHDATVGALLTKLHLTLNQGDVVEPALAAVINQDDFRINIYRAVPVEIVDNGQLTYTFSAAKTPRAIVDQAGVHIYAEDYVTTSPVDDFLKDGSIGEQVVIDRATPISLNLYGTPLSVRTHATTVAALIQEKGIKLAKNDQVTPALTTPLTSGTQIFISRFGTKIESVTTAITTPVQTIDDPTLAFGTNAVRQAGSAGQEVTTYQDALTNGIVTGRSVIQQVVTVQPVTQIDAIGTSLSGIKGDMALAGIAPSDYTYVDYIVSHESGWCPTKAQGEIGTCPPYDGYVPSYGGYGLCQSTPGSKMSSAGSDWATNPITQLEWCAGYAHGRYGSWYNAYVHWMTDHNW